MVTREMSGVDQMIAVEMSCAEAWQDISEMIDGTLDDEMRKRMAFHLRHCTHCKAIYDGTLNTVQLLGDDKVIEMPPGLGERLFHRISAELF